MAALSCGIKNTALEKIACKISDHTSMILEANRKDLDQAEKIGLDAPMLKRLNFDQEKIADAVEGIRSLIKLEDPVGRTLSARELDTGLELYQVSRPIGVIGVIFESRPDALVQIAALCLKSGNAVLLKGGSEALNTNKVLAQIISRAGIEAGLADPKMAIDLSVDSKCQYVAVCNAIETILVHEALAKKILPALKKELELQGVKIYGCDKTLGIIEVKAATEEDWTTEYLDWIVSIRVVPSIQSALDHINHYGSGHTDVIVTADRQRALYFMNHADTADAFWNCSSRFCDGFRFGLGAEVGISTNKIHARGPVGLEGLMSYQWRLIGNGHKVGDYTGKNAKPFSHTPISKKFN